MNVVNASDNANANASVQPTAPFDPDDVVTTDRLDAYLDDARRPMLNNYTRHAKIGDGHHGEVYLCYQLNPKLPQGHSDRRIPVAMKSVKRDNPRAKQFRKLRQQRLPTSAHTPLVDRLGTTEAKIRKEIAIMKKCRHPHVVRLYEVIDDRSKEKIYMVMEYLAGGEVKWTNEHSQPILSYDQTRRIMRDAVLGLEYLHHQGIIHRDIKPANLLYTADRCQVKIADFGVSHFSYAQRLAAAGAGAGASVEDTEDILLDDSDLTKRAGTPSFLAPEIVYEHTNDPSPGSSSSADVPSAGRTSSSQSIANGLGQRPPITKSIDVWALGVTLYCLLFGKTPFTADLAASGTEWSLYNSICNLDWAAEAHMCADRVKTGGRHPSDEHSKGGMVLCLLDRLLKKDLKVRITLDEVKHHEWLLQDIPEPKEWLRLTLPKGKINVSASETSDAMSTIRFQWNWNLVARRVSSLFRRSREHNNINSNNNNNSNNKEAGGSSARDSSLVRGLVKSDPHAGVRAGLRRHQSARLPDDPAYPSGHAHTHTHTHAQGNGKRDKGKQREHLRPSTGEVSVHVRPKSTEPWPITGRGRGTAGASASASRSTSAIPFRRRGSGSLLSATTSHHHHAGNGSGKSDNANANANHRGGAGSSFVSSVATSTSVSTSTSPIASTSTSTSTPIDKDKDKDRERPRARFSNFFSVRHWRPNKFSSSSYSSTTSASASTSTSTNTPGSTTPTTTGTGTGTGTATGMASAAAPVFSRTNTDGTITMTRRSEEVLRQYQHHHAHAHHHAHHQHHAHQHGAPTGGGHITAERRASSWGQGDEGGLSAASSYDFLRPGAGVGVSFGGGVGAGAGAGGFAPRTPSRLSMNLATATADNDDEGEEGEGEASPTSGSPEYAFTPSDEVGGSGSGVSGAGRERRESDRFGPAYYDEDSSTIASVGVGVSVSGERWEGVSGEGASGEDAYEDWGESEGEAGGEGGGKRRGFDDEDEDEDEDEDDSDEEHGVVFSPRKRPQRASDDDT